jgi:hypothetical protein
MTATREQMIEAVRKDPNVGRGSCASIDECYTDEELWEVIKDASTEAEAVKAAYEVEGLRLEAALNARWGEDDDPQLKAWQDWQERTGE